MAVTAFLFGNHFFTVHDKKSDYNSDVIKCSLHTVTYVPSQDNDDFFNDCTNELSTAGGYTAGGTTITTPTILWTGGTNVFNFDANDAAWTSASFTCRIAVVYNSTPGTAATNPVASYVDMGGDQTVSSATFTIQFASGGIFTVTVS